MIIIAVNAVRSMYAYVSFLFFCSVCPREIINKLNLCLLNRGKSNGDCVEKYFKTTTEGNQKHELLSFFFCFRFC